MSGYNPEFDSDGDWDDRGDLAWNEYDWQRYLKQSDQELHRFFSLYKKMRQHPNRLDEIARLMGWDREDWNAGEIANSKTEDAEASEDANIEGFFDEEFSELDDMEPYTVHRHPVYVVTRALYQNIQLTWSELVHMEDVPKLEPGLVLDFTQSLQAGEHHAMMGINALDMGDFTLCVTHLKFALSAINSSFGFIQTLPTREHREYALFHADVLPILFDLRDLWLRVMMECREEHRRGFRNDE